MNDVPNENNGNNYRIKNNKLNVSKSFEYKTNRDYTSC